MSKYKSFIKWNIPKNFDYDTDVLEDNGYKIKGRFNKTNPEFKEYCKNLKDESKEFEIIDLGKNNNMIDIWVK